MKISIIERLSLQAQRMQAMTDSLAKVFGPETLLVDNLTREVAVTLSIRDQAKAEATIKVEETAAASTAAPETKPEAKEAIPDHIQDVADHITRLLKAQGFDVNIIPVGLSKL